MSRGATSSSGLRPSSTVALRSADQVPTYPMRSSTDHWLRISKVGTAISANGTATVAYPASTSRRSGSQYGSSRRYSSSTMASTSGVMRDQL